MNSIILFGCIGLVGAANYYIAKRFQTIATNVTPLTKDSKPDYYYCLWNPTTVFPLFFGTDSREFITKEYISKEYCYSNINLYPVIKKTSRFEITMTSHHNLLPELHNIYSVKVNPQCRGVPVGDQYLIVGYYDGNMFVNNNDLIIEKDGTIENIIERANDYVTISHIVNAIILVSGFAWCIYKKIDK